MAKKSDLLKELGWDDRLIEHFLIDNSDYTEKELIEDNRVTVYDSSSFTIAYNVEESGSSITF